MSFPMYPEYKYSDAEWLGKVPNNWTVAAIKWLSPVLRGASPRPIDDPIYFDDDGEYGWVRISDVTASKDGYLKGTSQKLSAIGSSLSVKLEPGKLFLSIAGSVGKPCITKIQACIHDGFVYFPLLNIDQRFLYRIFELGSCFGGLGKMGTQLNLNTDTVGGILIAIPPMTDLTNILRFLDYETAKIDTLIHEQKRLIELLKEKRQAVISHAVTKGLDPDVPMKDSGVEWLGEVPVHWEASRLNYHVTTRKGVAFKADDFSQEGIPVVKASDIKDRSIRGTSTCISGRFLAIHSKAILRAGDIVLSTVGSHPDVKASAVGQIAKVPSKFSGALLNQNTVIFDVADKQVVREYLFFVLQTSGYRDHLDINAHGTANQVSLNVSDMLDFPFLLPPLKEQRLVASRIKAEIDKLKGLNEVVERTHNLLLERRSALISAAVTGKIDVRDWQPPADESTFDEKIRQAEIKVTA